MSFETDFRMHRGSLRDAARRNPPDRFVTPLGPLARTARGDRKAPTHTQDLHEGGVLRDFFSRRSSHEFKGANARASYFFFSSDLRRRSSVSASSSLTSNSSIWAGV